MGDGEAQDLVDRRGQIVGLAVADMVDVDPGLVFDIRKTVETFLPIEDHLEPGLLGSDDINGVKFPNGIEDDPSFGRTVDDVDSVESHNLFKLLGKVIDVDVVEIDQVGSETLEERAVEHIDQAQSLNIFISLDKASGRYLNEIYMEAWRFGLKSTYYLRSQSPEAVAADEGVEDRSMECVGCQ
jgi:hypothetical protein